MSFNSVGQYTPNHKAYDRVGNILPGVEHSEGCRPAVEFKPAEWLPVQFYDKHYEQWVVIMPGKLVALDPDGKVMPAHYGLTSATVAYTADDVTAGTIDVATGLPVVAAKTVTLSQLTGTKESGWTTTNAGAAKTSGFMGRYGESFGDSVAKYPIGVAPQAYLQWAGGDGSNPANFRHHNYNMQHQVPVLCDYVLSLPLIPGQVAAEATAKTATGSALVIGTNHWHTRTNVIANATGRYAAGGTVPVTSADTVVALALDNYPIATNTARTTIAFASDNTADDLSGVLLNEVGSVAAVNAAGDFFVDTVAGVIFVYSSNGTDLPSAISGAAGSITTQYYHYATAAGTYGAFACVLTSSTELKPGDFLECGAGSNFVRANPAAGSSNCANLMAQVIGFEQFPKDGLERVRTAYNPALQTNASGAMSNATLSGASTGAGQLDQMPGSATGGMPASVSYSGAADTVVILNLISR